MDSPVRAFAELAESRYRLRGLGGIAYGILSLIIQELESGIPGAIVPGFGLLWLDCPLREQRFLISG